MTTPLPPLRVAVVEADPATRARFAALLGATPWLATAGVFPSMEEALAALDLRAVDVILIGLGPPGTSEVDEVRRLRERRRDLPILVLTVSSDDHDVFRAICAGADGCLLKDTPRPRLLDALLAVCAGGAPLSPEVARNLIGVLRRLAPPATAPSRLSPRECQVLDLLAEGHSYKTAAGALGVSQDTIRFHIRHIYDKLHVHSKSQAVMAALRLGLVR
jgi:DNA-binding NarL/FixJ family response regulator